MAEQQKFEVQLPGELKQKYRHALATELIDYIVKRTKSGRNNEGSQFPKYSKSYVNSLDFKIAGKKRRPVNLTLSGDMLNSIQLLREKKDSIQIGFTAGDPDNGKAEGNQLGSYGGTPKKRLARPFLDFKGKEEVKKRDQLIKKYFKYQENEDRLKGAVLALIMKKSKLARGLQE